MSRLKQYKNDENFSYAIGVYPVLELLKHKKDRVFHVIVGKKYRENEGAMKILTMCEQEGIPYDINDFLLEKFAQNGSAHAVGFFDKYEQSIEIDQPHVVLVNPTDMGNIGTIMRTMVGFGFKNLVLVRPALDVFSPKVIRASMGEFFQLNITYVNTFEEYRSLFPTYEKFLFMFDKDAIELQKLKVSSKKFALVFGAEGPGLPPELRPFGTPVKIKQSKNIDSLNLSIAVGISLYSVSLLD